MFFFSEATIKVYTWIFFWSHYKSLYLDFLGFRIAPPPLCFFFSEATMKVWKCISAPGFSELLAYGLILMTIRLWLIAHDYWPMAYCSWLLAYGLVLVTIGLWLIAHDYWPMAYCSWLFVYGLLLDYWPMAYCSWLLVYGLLLDYWPMAYCSWLLAYGLVLAYDFLLMVCYSCVLASSDYFYRMCQSSDYAYGLFACMSLTYLYDLFDSR